MSTFAISQKSFIRAFIGLGLLACLVLILPDIVFVGFALLVIPGLILWAAPPAFMYLATATLAFCGLVRLPKWGRLVGSALAVCALAIVPPLATNLATESQVKNWTSSDQALADKVGSADTVAVLLPAIIESSVDGKATTECEELCQRLLYNHAAKRVIIGLVGEGAVLELPKQADLVAYHVERRDSCAIARLGGSWLGDFRSSGEAVATRIAHGECLVKGTATLDDAQWIVVQRMVYRLPRIGAPSNWSLRPIISWVRRLELYARSEVGLRRTFRRTEVAALPLGTPFVVGSTSIHFPFPASTGIWRHVEFINKYSFAEQAKLIFGSGANPIER